MFDILKQIPSHVGDYTPFELWLNVIGGVGILIGMIIAGMIFLARASKSGPEEFSKRRVRLTRIFGWALIACAFSRGIDVICLWTNMPILAGYAKNLTWILLAIMIYSLPALFKETNSHEEIKRIRQEMQKTNEQMKEIGEKLKS
jgi:uncharacterized membrane protein